MVWLWPNVVWGKYETVKLEEVRSLIDWHLIRHAPKCIFKRIQIEGRVVSSNEATLRSNIRIMYSENDEEKKTSEKLKMSCDELWITRIMIVIIKSLGSQNIFNQIFFNIKMATKYLFIQLRRMNTLRRWWIENQALSAWWCATAPNIHVLVDCDQKRCMNFPRSRCSISVSNTISSTGENSCTGTVTCFRCVFWLHSDILSSSFTSIEIGKRNFRKNSHQKHWTRFQVLVFERRGPYIGASGCSWSSFIGAYCRLLNDIATVRLNLFEFWWVKDVSPKLCVSSNVYDFQRSIENNVV